MTATLTLKHGDFTLELAGDFTKTQAYLLQYGFTQSMQDAVAGTAKAVRDLAADCRKGGDGFDKAMAKWTKTLEYTVMPDADFAIDADVEKVASMAMHQDATMRYEAILTGTVGTRSGGGRLPPVDRTMAEIAEEEIRAAHATRKIKLPDAAGMRDLVQRHLAKNGERLGAEAVRRIESAKAAADSAAELLG